MFLDVTAHIVQPLLNQVPRLLQESCLKIDKKRDSDFENKNFAVEQKVIQYPRCNMKIQRFNEERPHPASHVQAQVQLERVKMFVQLRQVLPEVAVKEGQPELVVALVSLQESGEVSAVHQVRKQYE